MAGGSGEARFDRSTLAVVTISDDAGGDVLVCLSRPTRRCSSAGFGLNAFVGSPIRLRLHGSPPNVRRSKSWFSRRCSRCSSLCDSSRYFILDLDCC